jgi:hypothetical protein
MFPAVGDQLDPVHKLRGGTTMKGTLSNCKYEKPKIVIFPQLGNLWLAPRGMNDSDDKCIRKFAGGP